MKLNTHNQTSVKRFLLLVGVFCFTFFKAQINLVPNPSFEDSVAIPQGQGELNKTQNWYVAGGSPDYYSLYSPTIAPFPQPAWNIVHIPYNMAGYQNARTGDFYTGMVIRTRGSLSSPPFSTYRECMGIKLIQPLLSNHSYSFTLYYSLSDASGITTSQLSAYFSISQFILPNLYTDTNSYYNYLQTQINHDSSFITDTTMDIINRLFYC